MQYTHINVTFGEIAEKDFFLSDDVVRTVTLQVELIFTDFLDGVVINVELVNKNQITGRSRYCHGYDTSSQSVYVHEQIDRLDNCSDSPYKISTIGYQIDFAGQLCQ